MSGDPAGDWPRDGLERVTDCPVCGGIERRVMYSELRDWTFGVAPGSWTFMRCEGCGSAYLDPRPTPDTIGLAYRAYYTHAAVGPTGEPNAGRLREGLASDYRKARWGYASAWAIPGGRIIPRLARSRAAIVDREIRHLPAIENGRLLDVGCGSGAFVAQMGSLGWRAEGIDPDPEAVARAREAGLDVAEGTLADVDDDEHSAAYDAITLSHVIEHLHDPPGDLRRVHRLLRPGGLLWLGTPNLSALGLRRFGRHWRGLEAPRHLVLLTPASAEGLLQRTGFEGIEFPTAFPHGRPMFRESAAIADGRRPDEGPRRDGRWARALAAIADRVSLRDPSYGEELVVVARRPA